MLNNVSPESLLALLKNCPWRKYQRWRFPTWQFSVYSETELAEEPAMTEGRGSRKRRGKHPTTLYECDCGEVISGGEVEHGEGLIECNKAGCETQWVSLQRDVEISTVTHRHHELYSFIWSACDLTSRYRTGSVSCVQHRIVTGNDRRNEMGLDNRPNHMIYTYLEGDSHTQLVSPSLEALKKISTWYA